MVEQTKSILRNWVLEIFPESHYLDILDLIKTATDENQINEFTTLRLLEPNQHSVYLATSIGKVPLVEDLAKYTRNEWSPRKGLLAWLWRLWFVTVDKVDKERGWIKLIVPDLRISIPIEHEILYLKSFKSKSGGIVMRIKCAYYAKDDILFISQYKIYTIKRWL